MPRQAGWAKKLSGESSGNQQMTVVRRIPTGQGQGYGMQTDAFMMASSPMFSDSSARITGGGVDGVVQPGKMTGQVHEGEGVIPANAMQGLTPEEFAGFVQKLSSGQIDKNLFRKSIGKQPVAEYQTGGIVDPTDRVPTVDNTAGTLVRGVNGDNRVPSSEATPATQADFDAAVAASQPTVASYTASPVTRTDTALANVQPMTSIKPQEATTVNVTPVPVEPTNVTVAPQTREAVTAEPMASLRPQETTTVTVAPHAATTTNQAVAEAQPTVTQPITTPATTSTTGTAEQSSALSTSAEQAVQAALQNLTNQMNGMSEADKTIANYYLSNLDASNAASIRVAAHQISSDPNLSNEAKQSAIAGLQRVASTEHASLAGELAVASAERASQAARDVISYGQQIRAFEAEQEQYKDSQEWLAYEAALEAEDYDTAANAYRSITGNDISMDNMKAYHDYLVEKREQDLMAGDLSLDQQALTNESLKNTLGDEMWNSVQEMIDSGASLEQVNARLAEQGKTALTSTEYAAMLDATSLGERNWGRSLAAANMLLSTPGAENKEKAAAIYEELYPGIGIDFEDVILSENAEQFATGLSTMAEYVTSGMTYEEALSAIEASGLSETMGLDTSQIQNLYNALRVNAIDEEWNEFEESEFYQSLTPEEQAEQEEFFRQKMLGKLDYETLHEYEIYDAAGNLINTIYGADSTEADKYAAKYGYTVSDTGNIKFAAASTITDLTTEEETGETSTADAWTGFKETQASIPEDEQIGYDAWVEAGKPETYDEMKEVETPVSRLDSIEVNNYSDLLTKGNYDKLFEAYSENPEEVKGSEYYYNMPDMDYISKNVKANVNFKGESSFKLSNEFKSSLEENIGKMTTVTDFENENNIYTGQMIGYLETPHSIQIKLRLPDGTINNVPIVTPI